MTKNRVARRCIAFADHAHIPSAAARTGDRLCKVCPAMAQVDVRARPARLRYFQNHLVQRELIADTNIILVGAEQGQILAERTLDAVEILFGAPPWPMGGIIGANRLIESTMYQAIGLLIAGDAFAADENGVGHNGRLADRRTYRPAVAMA